MLVWSNSVQPFGDSQVFEIDPGKLADEARYDGIFAPRGTPWPVN